MPEPSIVFETIEVQEKQFKIDVILKKMENGDLVFTGCSYKGMPILKHPADLRMILSAISAVRPTLIIETGTAYGGTALLYSDFLKDLHQEKLYDPSVITIENGSHFSSPLKLEKPLENYILPELTSVETRILLTEKRVLYIEGDTVSNDTIASVAKHCDGRKVMVNLDSDHHTAHVLSELRAYSEFVSIGSYMIVEDMLISGLYPHHGPGPDIAVKEFLEKDDRFEIDTTKNQEGSLNFNGYLKRVR